MTYEEKLANPRFVVEEDGKAGFVSRFSRKFGVVDTKMLDGRGRPVSMGFETNDRRRAEDYAHQCNFGRVVR